VPNNQLNARAAAHEKWAKVEDRTAATAPARRAFEARFKNENQRKAYFLRLALASAKARRARKAGAPHE
jgi:hypothetical protein